MRDQYLNKIMEQLGEKFPAFDHTTIRMIAALTNTYHILLSVMERALSGYGITPQSMDVLVALYVNQEHGCPLGEIGEMLMVSPANITGLVEGLVKKGLVSRTEHPEDRRKRLVKLTPAGLSLVEEMIPESARFFQVALAPLTREDKQQLTERLGMVSGLLLPYWERRIVPNFRRPLTEPAAGAGSGS